MRPNLPTVLSATALAVALFGSTPLGEAALDLLPKNSVGARELKPGAVGTPQLAANAVTGPKVRLGTLRAAHLRPADTAFLQTPAGPAGGALAGAYPSPLLAAGAVGLAAIDDALEDGAAGTPALRSLGTGPLQATAGDDPRLSNSRPPSGAAGGALTGTYPSPALADNAVTTAKIGNLQVTEAKIGNLQVSEGKLAGNAVTSAKVLDNSLRLTDFAVWRTGITVSSSTLPATSCRESSFPIAAAQVGDLVLVVPQESVPTGIVLHGLVVGTNGTVRWRECNVTGAPIATGLLLSLVGLR